MMKRKGAKKKAFHPVLHGLTFRKILYVQSVASAKLILK